MEDELAQLKRDIFWLGISCMCSGIGLILCSYLFHMMERRFSILTMHLETDRRNIEGLYAIQERKTTPVPVRKETEDRPPVPETQPETV